MYISRFQVVNYKSFLESTILEFTPGFNIVSGQNNAGKTALLEALGLGFGWHPHRSIKTMPARDTAPSQISRADVSFTMSPKEVTELMLISPGTEYHVAKPDVGTAFAQQVGCRDDSDGSAQRLLDALFSYDFLTFKLRFQSHPGHASPVNVAINMPSYGLYAPQGSTNSWHMVGFRVEGNPARIHVHRQMLAEVDFGHQLAGQFQRHVYRFSAERLNVGKGAHGDNTSLLQNASNLAEVLNQLQHNTIRFRHLNHQLNTILPQVKQVSVRAIARGQVEIVVWCHNPESLRDDLAVPLAESGTGIGQVLAILYVVMTAERPQTIIIDEPQSFLHPGAARKLIDFLKLHTRHQFIIATHSATIIAAVKPKTITLARSADCESTVEQLDATLEKGIQATLAELGIRLSDVFGADNILWVEGRTEEKCFPLIIDKLLRCLLKGTEILGIRQTGDLEGRDARKIFEIYRRLAQAASLLPPAVAFILDDECRDEATKNELVKLSGDRATFLRRRMYENYLLNPAAIAETANAIENFRTQPVTPQEVRAAIEEKLKTQDYFTDAKKMSTRDDQIKHVNGGKVLKDLFSELSGTRVAYQKVLHGIALTEWIIEHAPGDFDEVTKLLSEVIAPEGKGTKL